MLTTFVLAAQRAELAIIGARFPQTVVNSTFNTFFRRIGGILGI